MIEWILLALVVAAIIGAIVLPRGSKGLPKDYCDVECKDCEGCK